MVAIRSQHPYLPLQAWLGHKNIQHAVRYTELALAGTKRTMPS
jgi:hypothetical protein